MLAAGEAEAYINELKQFRVEDVGSFQWMKQMMNIERLNVAAHMQAAQNQFEHVADYIRSTEKVTILVHELLAADLFVSQAMPKIKTKSDQMAFGRIFMTERSASTILNLLELVLFKIDEVSEIDALIPLIDFCNRQIAKLAQLDLSSLVVDEPDPALMSKFQVGFSALSILWCIICGKDIQLSVIKRLVDDDDVASTIAELILHQPWRAVKRGKIIKWFNGELRTLKPSEALTVCPPEAHAWTALQQLLEPRFLEMTKWSEYRRDILVQCADQLSEVLIDQLPPLNALRQSLQYLKMNQIPPQKFTPVVEQVPEMVEEFQKKRNWDTIVSNSISKYFNGPRDQLQRELLELSQLFEIFAQ